MLTALSIRNLVLIDQIDVELKAGLTVLTGETGAGKSILLDGIGLALGKRSEARMVRSGTEKALVSATFDIISLPRIAAQLTENDIEHDGDIIIRRTVSADGRSKSFINDIPVSLQLLQKIGTQLMEIHGQHDQRGLLDSATHLSVLDDYIGDATLLERVSSAHGEWRAAHKIHDALLKKIETARQEQEYNEHAAAELQQLNPKIDEEEQLATKRAQLQHQEKIAENVIQALSAITGERDITHQLSKAERILARLPDEVATNIAPAVDSLDRAHIELSEAIDQLEQLASAKFDVRTLENTEERLFALRDVARKHQCTVDELPAKRAEFESQIEALESDDRLLAEAKAAITASRDSFAKHADELSKKRHTSAKKLEKNISDELALLKMEKAKIMVEVTSAEDESQWHAGGLERVQFVASTNPGSKAGPLHKIASGGELSRFMLACKMALAATHGVPSMIFDEIDTGVGGAVADKIGNRLRALSNSRQVFCVTHLPQVAAYGTAHLLIEKNQGKDSTSTHLYCLDKDAKEQEIARMLAGQEITGEAIAAAKKLIEDAA